VDASPAHAAAAEPPLTTGTWGEAALLGSLARGERAAAERLLESTYRQTYRALFRLCGGDAELAADLTQETYRKAWQSLAGFDGRAQLATWLYRIAYNTFLNHLRRPRPVPLEPEQEASLADPAAGPAERHAAGEQARRLRRAVLALPEELRFAVTAHYWQGVPVREIARLEEVTSVAVRKRLKRAFAVLRQTLEEAP
jgi:RNA polymerase sigma-70 factor, ECF subfamily